MVEFIKTVSEAEKKSYYLNLNDDSGKSFGYDFPIAGTKLWIFTHGRKYKASKRGNTQIWGDLAKWFRDEKIKAGDKIIIKYDPKNLNTDNRVPVDIHLLQSNNELPDEDISPVSKDIVAAEKIHQLVYRVLRDTVAARLIKTKYEFNCQLCGKTVNLADGKRYAEVHHIKPLGIPHNGPDSSTNIICVCPNHHVQLDYGAIRLEKSKIRILVGHEISDEFIKYHNEVICSIS